MEKESGYGEVAGKNKEGEELQEGKETKGGKAHLNAMGRGRGTAGSNSKKKGRHTKRVKTGSEGVDTQGASKLDRIADKNLAERSQA